MGFSLHLYPLCHLNLSPLAHLNFFPSIYSYTQVLIIERKKERERKREERKKERKEKKEREKKERKLFGSASSSW
jgi:hypothetical protein